MSRLVGIGRPTLDRVIAVPDAPRFDTGSMLARTLGVYGGGPVATALASVARLGGDAALIARVGADEAGAEIVRGLAAEGVATSLVAVSPATRSATSTILVNPAAARAILHDPGEATDPELGPRETDTIRQAAGLMLERTTPAALAGARIAREAGVPVLLDAGGYDERVMELAALSSVVIASSYHAQARGLDPEAAARELLALGPALAIVTQGEQGALALTRGTTHHEPAYPIAAVDTTGAGDVYHGAFFLAYLEGQPLPAAMRFAAVVAALKCRQPGGRAGIPTRAEAEQAARRRGTG